MRRKHTQILGLALVATLVVLATGCGSKSTSTSTTTTTTTTAAPTSTTAPATTSTSSGTTTSASGLGALSGGCAQFASLGTAFSSAFTGANGDVGKEAAAFQKFADAAPADIKPAFQTIAADFAKIVGALKGVNLHDPTALAKLGQLESSLDMTALSKAEAQISTWAAQNCHA